MSEANSQEPSPPRQPTSDQQRRAGNIYLLIGALVFIVAGIWLVDAMITARKADECLSSGRRNCAPIEMPARER